MSVTFGAGRSDFFTDLGTLSLQLATSQTPDGNLNCQERQNKQVFPLFGRMLALRPGRFSLVLEPVWSRK